MAEAGPQKAVVPEQPDDGDRLARDCANLVIKQFRDAGFDPRCAEIIIWHKDRPRPSHYTVIVPRTIEGGVP